MLILPVWVIIKIDGYCMQNEYSYEEVGNLINFFFVFGMSCYDKTNNTQRIVGTWECKALDITYTCTFNSNGTYTFSSVNSFGKLSRSGR